MRTVMMVLGLIMIVLAGLWFFTPVLDGAYSRYTPGIAHSHNRSAAVRTPATRSATPAPGASAPSITSVQDLIGSKALADNFMSMLNLGSGILGAWFTYMSYRLQARRRD